MPRLNLSCHKIQHWPRFGPCKSFSLPNISDRGRLECHRVLNTSKCEVCHVLYLLLNNPEKETSALNTGAVFSTGNERDHQWLNPALEHLSYRLWSDNSDTYIYTLRTTFRITLCLQLHLNNFHKFRADTIHLHAVSLKLNFTAQNDDFVQSVSQHSHQFQGFDRGSRS